jgi:hypothetical protein
MTPSPSARATRAIAVPDVATSASGSAVPIAKQSASETSRSLQVVMASPNEAGLLGERPGGWNRACHLVEEALDRLRRIVDRRSMNANEDVARLGNVDDGDAAFTSLARRGHHGRGAVAEQHAHDRPAIDDYSA